MARNRAMLGAGAGKMGGGGRKPGMPPTAMAGKPAGGPPPGLGAPPKPPKPMPPPPGAGAGAPPPMPGGAGGGGGMGGSGGFQKGGPAKKFEKGGTVGLGGADTKPRVKGGRDHD